MPDRKNLVLLYGGKSGEHEISLISAASVLCNLDTNLYNIIPIGMAKDGRFYLNDYQEMLQHKDSLPVQTKTSRPLASLLLDGKFAVSADVVFPVVHGPLYEDGCLQGLLELAGVAYVGCDVVSSAVAMDKEMTHTALRGSMDFKVARKRVLHWQDSNLEATCKEIIIELGLPLFVKPNAMGSSVGIHKAKSYDELLVAIKDARRYDETVVIEEAIVGREIELAVLESMTPNTLPQVSAAGEIKVNHSDGFYSYTAKYLESQQTDLIIPAALSDELLHRLQQCAAYIFTKLKCSGLARIDFFVNDAKQEIYFNEANTLPGFTTISMYPKLWQYSGIEYKELLNKLIDLGINRKKRRENLVTDYK